MTAAAIETQQRKLEALVARVEAAIDQEKGELDAKLTKLRTHWEKAGGRQKERIDAATTSTEEHFMLSFVARELESTRAALR